MCLCMQNINRMAHLKRTQFGKVDLDYVLGIGGFDLERLFNTFISLFLHFGGYFFAKADNISRFLI